MPFILLRSTGKRNVEVFGFFWDFKLLSVAFFPTQTCDGQWAFILSPFLFIYVINIVHRISRFIFCATWRTKNTVFISFYLSIDQLWKLGKEWKFQTCVWYTSKKLMKGISGVMSMWRSWDWNPKHTSCNGTPTSETLWNNLCADFSCNWPLIWLWLKNSLVVWASQVFYTDTPFQ